ncbi:opioid growth factor receptor-like [Brachyistius frenatus]|uniref:opioid growth factor receptor-like n=1 Tax=Brachyistius frenatus TaxID=100188 RepID=UPI0037E78678
MAWPRSIVPYRSWFERLCRGLTVLWRCITSMFPPILALSWRKYRENEPEVTDEHKNSREDLSSLRDDHHQHEAAVGKRAADFDPEPFKKRPKVEEDFDSEEYRVETTDELYCDYDSTWEAERSDEITMRKSRRLAPSRYHKFSRFETAAKDMQNYRHNYPTQPWQKPWKKQAPDDKPNLNFYLDKIPTLPDGVYLRDFHRDWYGQYYSLESVHSYIQWLFPLQEPGVNYEASTLTKEEIEEFCQNSTAQENLLTSYKLMLDFYGIELCNEDTGEVRRGQNWRDRFKNLNGHTHNSLRITRILKCLGTLGYPHYQAPLVRFFLEETLIHQELPNIKDSVLNYFMFSVLDKRQRRDLIKFAYFSYGHKDEFVWCPKKIQMLWSRQFKPQKRLKKDSFNLACDPYLFSVDTEGQYEEKETSKVEFVSDEQN